MKKNTSKKSVKVEHKMPVDVEMTKPNESQKEMVKGQGKILTEKKDQQLGTKLWFLGDYLVKV